MSATIQQAGLTIDQQLFDFISLQALPDTGLNADKFWQGFAELVSELTPINRSLLAKRDTLQLQIDAYHQQHPGWDAAEYKSFLSEIGYLVPEPKSTTISTENIDPEIALAAAPQLVVPVSNARFALNAANARWGSLYDALYGTDVLPEEDGAEKKDAYNPVRGFKVMAYARQFLDSALPLKSGSHIESTNYSVLNEQLVVTLNDSSQVALATPSQFKGFQGQAQNPSALLFEHHGLHIEIQIDSHHPIGQADKAGIKDVFLEAALTTIMDCEDSVAAVDAEDKVGVYGNWLGLMKGTLCEAFLKDGKEITRQLVSDRQYTSKSGGRISLKGRSMMFVRNVGHLMTNSAIIDHNGDEIFEGIMDAVITALCAIHDLKGNSPFKNSSSGSVNIVKPKMHGPEEVRLRIPFSQELKAYLSCLKTP